MLKYINYQLDSDDARQALLEQRISAQISQRLTANITAFAQHIPSVVPIIEQHAIQQYSVFCTRQGELNIVDFATGRVWYSDTPFAEVVDEVQSFCQQAPYIDLTGGKSSDHNNWLTEPLPASVDVVMMFGLGLGYQLNELLHNVRVKYLVVYEPSLDTLMCTIQANDWVQLFDTAAALGTQIFLQLGNDASAIAEDLAELTTVADIKRVYLYRHCFHPVMDSVLQHLFLRSGDKAALTDNRQHFEAYSNFYDYVAERNANVLGNLSAADFAADSDLYQRNLAALEKFYPKVHSAIVKHDSKHWRLVRDPHNKENLLHAQRNAFFYQDIDNESQQLVDYFLQHPYKDDVLLGQKTLGKLRNYVHFSHITKIQPLVTQQLQQQSQLPAEVDSLIIFGVALGRHIELLTSERSITNLYICEPNLDFFAASLHVTDWASIFKRADSSGQRIYLNLGGDGSAYFYDLMAQFYQVGAYSIANTYMLCSYFNRDMQKAISDLRSELRVVLALGEYYDHARYGIAHTYNSVKQGHRFLKHENSSYQKSAALDLPVFIIGNGPSLDQSFEYLKQYRDEVILISCGTALFSLYKHGIKPDFHAEVEQNRSTYFWVSQVEDKSWLKDISLLSVNGIHPDTAALFKQTLLCFKDGESSTYFFHPWFKNHGYRIASLSYAYPTVSNLVVNYILKLGCKVIYLFGVDLGYVDVRYHHSQASAYYRKDGTEVYNYQNTHGGGLPAKGNFLPHLITKPEFEVSRKLIEQAIKKANRKLEIYNCSNGVKIEGAIPLKPENILLDSTIHNKQEALTELLQNAYFPDLSKFADEIFSQIDYKLFEQTIKTWLALFDHQVNNRADAKLFIDQQWRLLRATATVKNDPTFCLFYGSTNYFGGVLTKLASGIDDEVNDTELITAFRQVLAVWRDYVQSGYEQYKAEPLKFDDVYVRLFEKT
uniref:Motility accessory factor n=1 Tax=Rheinheimera sp. BAL341 TaxID=1708203 RepID=A0A486XWB6_9GAMM